MFREYPYINMTDLNLDYLYKKIKGVYDDIDSLKEWRETHEAEYEELKALVDRLNNGELTPALVNSIEIWLSNNAAEIMSEWVKMVFFGLTDSGYFVAYVPANWSDITFKTTGWDVELERMPEYGHLILDY